MFNNTYFPSDITYKDKILEMYHDKGKSINIKYKFSGSKRVWIVTLYIEREKEEQKFFSIVEAFLHGKPNYTYIYLCWRYI